MSQDASLHRLSELAGIEPEYWDIWGNHHPIGPDSKRRILDALGLPAHDDAAVAASIRGIEEQTWRRCLPPVLVVHEGDRPEIPICLPASRAEWPVSVDVIEEDGSATEVMVRLGDLPVRDRRWIDGQELVRWSVPLAGPLPCGYHAVRLAGRPEEPMALIVAPRQCYLPESLQGEGRVWGLSAQLYTLRRPGNWGIGDFTDLAELVDVAGGLGADVIGLNPLHALFLAHPQDASPYSPSSRIFLNPLYIDVEAVPGFATCSEAQAEVRRLQGELTACRAGAEVAYRRVKPMKMAVLELLYTHFVKTRLGTSGADPLAFEFHAYLIEQEPALRRYALFEALSETFEGKPWHQWPEPYRSPDSPEVAEFARANRERVRFHEFLQWLADRQLAAAQARACERGLSVGVYRDLAVGASRDGADAWADQESIVQKAKVGCPPDPFNMLGQDWGIPPLHPLAMRASGYAPVIAMLRANMRHAGGLRIDHVMGLMHLFWIPIDGRPADGAYVRYAFDEILGILALESQRNRCFVVGEDLGTVPAGFRERMTASNVLSYRVLYFEKDGDRFKRPQEYPSMALACVTTHDLATLMGFWQGADLELKRRLNQYPSADAQRGDEGSRRWDKILMLRALAAEALLPNGIDTENPESSAMTPHLIAALHAYLARSPARILLVQVDDLMQELDQINLPGTVFERPNWRRRLSLPAGELPGTPVMKAFAPLLAGRTD